MIEPAAMVVEIPVAPPLVPAQRPIDLDHLSRMTLADHALEREVLALFDRQILMMMERIGSSERKVATGAAHTLKGSATGIGAWQVASAAAALEEAAKDDDGRWSQRVASLEHAVHNARTDISELLQAD